MNREYLEDYQQKELEEYNTALKKMKEGTFSFEKDRLPRAERFIKFQRPATTLSLFSSLRENIWAQLPFSGSSIFLLFPCPKRIFEYSFRVSEIPEIIDFIKETGKLQICLTSDPRRYEGLDYLDSIFEELRPPIAWRCPNDVFADEKEIKKAQDVFLTLAKVRYGRHKWEEEKELTEDIGHTFTLLEFADEFKRMLDVYVTLKICRYKIVEDIENLMIDRPAMADVLLYTCSLFLIRPIRNLCSDTSNFTLEEMRLTKMLPSIYKPQEIRFPSEIGKFLMRKMTYAAQNMRACYDLIDHYDAYDLQKVQTSLNEALIANRPDIVTKSAEELSEILDNIWSDKTIPSRIKGLKIGVPLSVAVVGGVAAGLVGAVVGGFLASLGFKVADKAIDSKTEGLSERLAKLKTKSYQANVYDFKKKYRHRIVIDPTKKT